MSELGEETAQELGDRVENLVPYPPWARSEEERLRFDLAVAIACAVMDAPAESSEVWAAARAIYSGPWPT